ncbi:MAG: hypothetical protein K9M75_09095, partial [Phycisphaerae bacterium]|nr:hypothetical protein [Phycisphaerae bacterium]
ATYGAGEKNVDITAKVLKLIAADIKNINNFNNHFGDPIEGTPKTLEITYELKGKTQTLEIPEGTELVL